jgi:hypothetical protein
MTCKLPTVHVCDKNFIHRCETNSFLSHLSNQSDSRKKNYQYDREGVKVPVVELIRHNQTATHYGDGSEMCTEEQYN